jgi:hypothetical protein
VPAPEPKVVYASHPKGAPEAGLGALSAIYHRAIQRYEEQKKGGPETAPDAVRKDQDAHTATKQYTR